ncbi:hypothetical protein GCM10009128_06160 [Psychrosphaera haliotis]|uniref:recombinase family protein n=1 Tax=Psychrosphaera haliotis TaxID=555083 RepID=UPI0031CF1569
MKKIIVSYNRVSTKKQSKEGIGLDIQIKSNNTAINRLMEEDQSFVRLDDISESESAFKGGNIDTIMNLVLSGLYAGGSIIVIYDQTRFSRMEPVEVITLMNTIIKSGFKLHFSASNKTIDSLKKIEEIILPLVNAGAAHAESENRSNRTKDSYQTRLNAIKSGDKTALVNVGNVPSWIDKKYEGRKITGYTLNDDRAAVIKIIYEKYIGGLGANAIVGWLNANVEPWGNFDYRRKDINNKVWGETAVSKILRNESVIGAKTFNRTNDHQEVTINDYFPPAISKELYYKAKEVRENRVGSQVHRTKHPSIFYIGLAKCGYCGGSIVPQNFKNKRAAVRCSAHAKQQTTECAGGSHPARFLEKVLVELCSDEVNYNLLFEDKVDVNQLKAQLAVIIDIRDKLLVGKERANILFKEGLMTLDEYKNDVGGDNDKLNELEPKILNLTAEIEKATHIQTGTSEEFLELLKQAKADGIPNDLRLRLKDHLRAYISRIDIYRYGEQWKTEQQWQDFKAKAPKEVIEHIWEVRNPFEKSRANLCYNIIFKNGQSRYVAFDYKTETWSFTATPKGSEFNSQFNLS